MSYKASSCMTREERIKLAGDDAKDRLYERKQNQKAIKVLTVAAYVLCVSLAAIMLSLYYVFIWDPTVKPKVIQPRANCDKIPLPDNLINRLSNASEISLEIFLKNFKLDNQQRTIQMNEIKKYPDLFQRIEQNIIKIRNEMMTTTPAIQTAVSKVTKAMKIPIIISKDNLIANEEIDEDDEEEEDDDEEDDNDDNDDDDDDTENNDYEPSGQNELFEMNSNNDTRLIFDEKVKN